MIFLKGTNIMYDISPEEYETVLAMRDCAIVLEVDDTDLGTGPA